MYALPIVSGWITIAFEQSPKYLVLPVVVFTFAMVLLAINQYYAFAQRFKKPLSAQSDASIKDTFIKRLIDEGYSVSEEQQKDVCFQLIVRDQQQRPVIITRPNTTKASIMFWAVIKVKDEDKSKFAGLPKQISSEMIENLRIELARFGIGFMGVDHPLQEIRLEHVVQLSELDHDLALTKEIHFVVRAEVLAFELVKRSVRMAKSQQISGQEGTMSSPPIPDKGGSGP